jgi:hypothetical protein
MLNIILGNLLILITWYGQRVSSSPPQSQAQSQSQSQGIINNNNPTIIINPPK